MEARVNYQKYTVGAIIEIALQNKEYYCYGQLLNFSQCVIFDFKTEKPLLDYVLLSNCRVLCRVTIDSDIITNGICKKVGYMQLRKEFSVTPLMYIFHEWDNSFYTYNVINDDIVQVDKDVCRELERCVVWSLNRLTDRIQAHFEKRPCKWLQQHYELFPE